MAFFRKSCETHSHLAAALQFIDGDGFQVHIHSQGHNQHLLVVWVISGVFWPGNERVLGKGQFLRILWYEIPVALESETGAQQAMTTAKK